MTFNKSVASRPKFGISILFLLGSQVNASHLLLDICNINDCYLAAFVSLKEML